MTAIAAPTKKRIDSIDILRGLVMVIMALDHTRDFFTSISYKPTDLTQASTALFLTRFITHYCAATFVFLAGTGAFLFLHQHKSKIQATKFLASRGLWLVILELTLIHLAWGGGTFLQVIWVIGVSMIVLSVLIYLPVPLIAAFGLLLIFGHNAFDQVSPASFFCPAESMLWTFLHVQGMVNIAGIPVFVMYPLIPWVGVMATGYAFGTLFKLDAAKRKKLLLTFGFSAIALFIILRYFNIYGDPSHWADQGTLHRTLLSFINVQKYPPSLDYLLITLGPGMILLAWFEGVNNGITNVLVVFGRVPLFYYLMHLYLLKLMAGIGYLIVKPVNGFTASLPVVYLLWITAVFILYFPSRWFMQYKRTHKQWWLGYL